MENEELKQTEPVQEEPCKQDETKKKKCNKKQAEIDAALAEVRQGPRREVPNHLRDRHRPGSDSYGPYLYPHDYPAGWVEQQYLPDGLARGAFYTPGVRGWEAWRIESTARDRAGGEI